MDAPRLTLPGPHKPVSGFHPELQFTRSYRDHVPYFTQGDYILDEPKPRT
jgi:hypothetical protein